MRRLAFVTLAGVACTMHEPGTSLGTFSVSGALKTQTCGAAMQSQALDPWTFDVRLSRSGSTLFWLQDAAPAISGIVDPSGNVTLKSTQTYDVSASDGGAHFCSVDRTDTFTAALGTSPSPTSFTGTIAYHYEVSAGADCTGQLAAFGAVPCDVGYDLTAKRTK